MGIARKIAHKAEAIKSSAKKTASRLTEGRRLRTGGWGYDQAAGNIEQAGAKIKDASEH